ncbi:unnamed protein product [[Candida] boidinii]|nr:unnamed protein product [[Candida] boidinii]
MNKDSSVSSGDTIKSSIKNTEEFYDMDQVNQENQVQEEEDYHVDESSDKALNADHEEDDGYIHLTPSPTIDEISKPREIIFLLTLAYTQLITQAVLSQSVVPANVIARDLGVLGQAGEISWFSASF